MIKNLINQLDLLQASESHVYKKGAYKNAMNIFSKMDELEFEIREDFRDIKGIGNSINAKVLEFKSKGIIEKVRELAPIKERKSYTTLKKSYLEIDRIIKGEIEFKLISQAGGHFVGSYRRKSTFIGDIDILLDDYHYEYFSGMIEICPGYELLVKGNSKTSFRRLEDDIQVDLNRYHSIEELPFALLHHTGSVESNIKLRSTAKKYGMTLNQYGLFLGSHRIEDLYTEQDIFEYLGLQYLEPEKR